MNHPERNLLIVDLETTGLDPQVHEIIEIGAILVEPWNLREIGRMEVKTRPSSIELANPIALAINGYNEEEWKYAMDIRDGLRHLADMGENTILAGWNISFDKGFLQAAYKIHCLRFPFHYHSLDIASLAWFTVSPVHSMSMKNMSTTLNVSQEDNVHRAINGAENALRILNRLYALKRKSEFSNHA